MSGSELQDYGVYFNIKTRFDVLGTIQNIFHFSIQKPVSIEKMDSFRFTAQA